LIDLGFFVFGALVMSTWKVFNPYNLGNSTNPNSKFLTLTLIVKFYNLYKLMKPRKVENWEISRRSFGAQLM